MLGDRALPRPRLPLVFAEQESPRDCAVAALAVAKRLNLSCVFSTGGTTHLIHPWQSVEEVIQHIVATEEERAHAASSEAPPKSARASRALVGRD